MIKTKLTWYSLSTVVFPKCPTVKSSMRIPVTRIDMGYPISKIFDVNFYCAKSMSKLKSLNLLRKLANIILHVRSKYCYKSCITSKQCTHPKTESTRVQSEIQCRCCITISSFNKRKTHTLIHYK